MDSGFIALVVIINIALSGLVAYVASEKGRSGASFFMLSFFLSFIVGILVVMALPPLQDGQSQKGKDDWDVDCIYCKESIKSTAIVCKHCGRDVEPQYERLKAEQLARIKQQQRQAQRAAAAAARELEEAAQQRRQTWLKFRVPVLISASIFLVLAVVISIVTGLSNYEQNLVEQAQIQKEQDSQLQERKKQYLINGAGAACPTVMLDFTNYFEWEPMVPGESQMKVSKGFDTLSANEIPNVDGSMPLLECLSQRFDLPDSITSSIYKGLSNRSSDVAVWNGFQIEWFPNSNNSGITVTFTNN